VDNELLRSPQKQAILDYLARLPTEEMARLEERALAEASAVEAGIYRRLSEAKGTLWQELRESLLLAHVSRNLDLLAATDPGGLPAVAK